MLYSFLLYSKVIELYVYIFFFTFFSIMVYHKLLNMAPCALWEDVSLIQFHV